MTHRSGYDGTTRRHHTAARTLLEILERTGREVQNQMRQHERELAGMWRHHDGAAAGRPVLNLFIGIMVSSRLSRLLGVGIVATAPRGWAARTGVVAVVCIMLCCWRHANLATPGG